jgi:hypothetical protein
MKKIAIAVAVVAAATVAAQAGSLVDPEVTTVTIVDETPSSTGGIIVPLLLLAILAVALI